MRYQSALTALYKRGIAESFPLHTTGYLLVAESILMLLSTAMFCLGEPHLYQYIISTALGGLVGIGLIVLFKSPDNVSASSGILAINLLWLVAILYGTTPYLIDGFRPSEAIFESISGFTTTGMSIITDVASLSNHVLIWRAMTGWAGGIGFIIMFCLLLRYFGLDGRNIFVSDGLKTTSSNSTKSIIITSLNFIVVYTILTVVLAIILAILGNDIIDSICISMSTISTTGFSTLNTDLVEISMASKVFIGGFLMLSAMNFLTLFDAMTEFRLRKIVMDPEIRHMFYWFIGSSVVMLIILYQSGAMTWNIQNVVDSILMIISIGTTTGFVFSGFTFPTVAMLFLCIVALIGGCRESPTGGIKVARLSLVFRTMRNTISTVGFPNEVRAVKFGDVYVRNSICYSALTAALLFIITAGLGTFAISVFGVDLLDALYLCISSLTTTGTGLYSVANVASIPVPAQVIMCILMWLGRMEITLALAMFTTTFWKESRTVMKNGLYALWGAIRRT